MKSSYMKRKILSKLLAKESDADHQNCLITKDVQSKSLKAALDNQGDYDWMGYFLNMSQAEVRFAANSLTDTLPTPQRLVQWKVSDFRSGSHLVNDTCQLCHKERGTLGHILGYCEVALSKEGGSRYTWRHNKILSNISQYAMEELDEKWTILNDLSQGGDGNVRNLLSSFNTAQRPDFIAVNTEEKSLIVMELTVPMETQIEHWHTTKTNKYADLVRQFEEVGYQVEFFAVEIGCRGLIPKSAVTFIRRLGSGKKRTRRFAAQLSQIAIKCSLRIFQSRSSKTWEVGS